MTVCANPVTLARTNQKTALRYVLNATPGQDNNRPATILQTAFASMVLVAWMGARALGVALEFTKLIKGLQIAFLVQKGSFCPMEAPPSFRVNGPALPVLQALMGPCTLCLLGTYKTGSGTAVCRDTCPANSTSPEGSASVDACICSMGFHSNGLTAMDCISCARGTLKILSGREPCTKCAPGSYQEDVRPCVCAWWQCAL